jgi:tetratricopeptide (TPR) repeat protein
MLKHVGVLFVLIVSASGIAQTQTNLWGDPDLRIQKILAQPTNALKLKSSYSLLGQVVNTSVREDIRALEMVWPMAMGWCLSEIQFSDDCLRKLDGIASRTITTNRLLWRYLGLMRDPSRFGLSNIYEANLKKALKLAQGDSEGDVENQFTIHLAMGRAELALLEFEKAEVQFNTAKNLARRMKSNPAGIHWANSEAARNYIEFGKVAEAEKIIMGEINLSKGVCPKSDEFSSKRVYWDLYLNLLLLKNDWNQAQDFVSNCSYISGLDQIAVNEFRWDLVFYSIVKGAHGQSKKSLEALAKLSKSLSLTPGVKVVLKLSEYCVHNKNKQRPQALARLKEARQIFKRSPKSLIGARYSKLVNALEKHNSQADLQKAIALSGYHSKWYSCMN